MPSWATPQPPWWTAGAARAHACSYHVSGHRGAKGHRVDNGSRGTLRPRGHCSFFSAVTLDPQTQRTSHPICSVSFSSNHELCGAAGWAGDRHSEGALTRASTRPRCPLHGPQGYGSRTVLPVLAFFHALEASPEVQGEGGEAAALRSGPPGWWGEQALALARSSRTFLLLLF